MNRKRRERNEPQEGRREKEETQIISKEGRREGARERRMEIGIN